MKILYFVLAAKAFGHEIHKASQIETWAHNANPESRVIWIYGDPTLAIGKLVGNDLFLPVDEKYENILEKTIVGLKWVLENLEFDYLIRTNTSNYFYDPLVRRHLQKLNILSNPIGGVQANWEGSILHKRRLHKYISGAGIYMSRGNVEVLANLPLADYTGIPDDVAIGHFLFSKNSKSKSIPRNDLTDFKPIWPTPQTRVKSWTDDQVTALRMHEVHNIYSAENDESLQLNLKELIKKEIARARIEKKRRAKILHWQYKVFEKYLHIAFRNMQSTLSDS